MARSEFSRWVQWRSLIALVPLLALGTSIAVLSWRQAVLVGGAVVGLLLVAVVCREWSIFPGEPLLLILVAGTAAFDRQFSYLAVRIGGVSLYVTELCMAALAGLLLARNMSNGGQRITSLSGLDLAILVYLAAGTLNVLRTVSLYGLEAIRDFAIFYYALFFFIALESVRTGSQLRRLTLAYLGGAAIALALGAVRLLTGGGEVLLYGVVRFLSGHAGMYVVIAAITVLCMHRFWRSQAQVALALLACAAGVFISQQRSVWLALLVALGVVAAMDWRGRLVSRSLAAGLGLAIGALVLAMLVLTPFQEQTTQVLENSIARLIAGFQEPQADPTARWRLAGWEEAVQSFLANPILASGLGSPFEWLSGRAMVQNRPHNTYLTILAKTGLSGMAPLLIVVAAFYSRAWRALRRATDLRHRGILLALTASHVALSVFGIFNLLLESPYLAIFFWGIMGVLVGVEQRQLACAERKVEEATPERMTWGSAG